MRTYNFSLYFELLYLLSQDHNIKNTISMKILIILAIIILILVFIIVIRIIVENIVNIIIITKKKNTLDLTMHRNGIVINKKKNKLEADQSIVLEIDQSIKSSNVDSSKME